MQFHRISKKIQSGVPMEHQLSGSVWDAAVWVPFVPWLDSIITAFIMVLNVCVQSYFNFNRSELGQVGLDAADLAGYLT